MFGEEDLIKIHKERSLKINTIVIISFFIIILRLWYLQIYQGEIYHAYSIKNRLRKEVLWAPRGQIFGRGKELLVDNVPRFDAVLIPQYFKNKKETMNRLSSILKVEVKDIKAVLAKNLGQAKYRPIIIKKNISLKELAKIETENDFLPGISVETFISREYKDQEVGAHLFGYISEISSQQLPKIKNKHNVTYRLGDFIGQAGIEQEFDHYLRGVNGYSFVEVDALGRKKKYINTDNLFKGIEDLPAVPGNNIFLTIDRDLQKAAYEALKEKTGGVVAMEVETGKILSMVSTPAFDPSQFSRGLSSEYWNNLRNNPENPMRDRTIQDHFSPGSVFKPFTGITALEENIIDHNSHLRCHGTFKLGSRTYHSWKRYGTEKVNIVNALTQSCNIFFYKVASEMDIDVLAKYSQSFGFGKRTGIPLPREASGLIPTKLWKQKRFGVPWQLGETLSCSIGQSFVLVTVLQLANAYAALANEGTLFRPYVVEKITNFRGEEIKSFEPKVINKIDLNSKTWKSIREGLYKVANHPTGTAFWRRGLGNQMAGKTGTSQVIRANADKLYTKCINLPYEHRHHGVFVAFAPYDNPKISVAVLVEHGCGGSSAAAPIAEKVITKYMQKYLPDAYEKNKEKEKKQLAIIYKSRQKKKEESANPATVE
ncbi:penicillin-binding protein 2 [Bacteriovoracaceae bacterium]|nr:penicillin-binding protein 2 [Bacteriovoracaceae bacterium]